MLNNEVYRQLIAVQGEQFRWLRALPCECYIPQINFDQQRGCMQCERGFIYHDQGLHRGLVTQAKEVAVVPELGVIRTSSLLLTTMPEAVMVGFGDRVVLVEREMLAREIIVRGDDRLPHLYPVAIRTVATSAGEFSPDDYELAGRDVLWHIPGPADGTGYAVEYTVRPAYWYVDEDLQPSRPTFGVGADGLTVPRTPRRGTLSLEPPAM